MASPEPESSEAAKRRRLDPVMPAPDLMMGGVRSSAPRRDAMGPWGHGDWGWDVAVMGDGLDFLRLMLENGI